MDPPSDPSYDDNSTMEQDDLANEILQATQSQPVQYQQGSVVDDHLWGFLQPCSPAHRRIDLLKIQPVYNIGRNPAENRILFTGFKVSEYPVLSFLFTRATHQLS
jgi:ser/thr/tyr protein kinase RAD53